MAGLVNIVIGGQNTGAVAALRQVENQLQSLAQRAAGALAASFGVGAMVEFTRRAIDAADALGKMAEKTGIAVQQLSGLGAVASADEVSLQSLQVAIKGLSEWMVKNGQASRDVNEVLLEQADIFARMPDGAAKTSLAMDRFGRAGQEMIPFLNKGSAAIREQMKEAEEFGAVIGPEFAAQANRFNDNLHRIALIFQGLFNQIARDLLPELNKFLESVIKITKEFGLQQGVLGTLIDLYKKLATAMEYVRVGFEGLLIISSHSQAKTTGEAAALAISPLVYILAKLRADKDKIEAELMAMGLRSMERLEEIRALGTAAEKPGASNAAGGRTKEDFALQYEALKTKLAQQQGFLADAAAAREGSAGERRKMQLEALVLIEKTLQELRTASATAYAERLITQTEHLKNEIGLKNQLLEVDKQRHELLADDSFLIRMQDNLRRLSDEWGNLGRNMADTLTDSLKLAVDGVADSITGAIYKTRTWGQVFYQVGQQIVSSLIRIFVQWALSLIGLDTVKEGLHAKDMARNIAAAPGKIINALAESISSYGVAGIIGISVLLAGIGTAIAAAVGAFAEGGIVRGGEQLIRVNERGQEAILNAQALANVGEGFVSALNAGLPIQQAAAASPTPSIKNNQQVTVAVFNDQAKMADWLRNQEGQNVIVDVVKANLHNITGRS